MQILFFYPLITPLWTQDYSWDKFLSQTEKPETMFNLSSWALGFVQEHVCTEASITFTHILLQVKQDPVPLQNLYHLYLITKTLEEMENTGLIMPVLYKDYQN